MAMSSGQVQLDRLTEPQLLARCIWGEARGEPIQGKLAVAHVVLNRVKAQSYYGKTIRDVILKPWQFSCFNENDPNLLAPVRKGAKMAGYKRGHVGRWA